MDLPTQLAWAAQLAVGATFAASAVGKIRAPAAFVVTVREYRLLPGSAVKPSAFFLILVEALIALGLLVGTGVEFAAPAAAVASLLFAAGAGINLRRGRQIDCGCFGATGETITGRTIARLGLLLSAAIAVTVAAHLPEPTHLSVSWAMTSHASLEVFISVAIVAISGLIAAAWVLATPELWEIRQDMRRTR